MKETRKKLISVKKEKATPLTIILFVLLILYSLILVLPLLWGLITSFTDYEWYENFYNFGVFDEAQNWKMTFVNFANAWKYLKVEGDAVGHVSSTQTYTVPALFLNSFLYSFGCALAFTLCPTIVAYAAARFKFKFSTIIYMFVVVALALPIVGSAPSEIKMLYNLYLDTYISGMWVLRFNFLSVYFLILYAVFDGIPKDYTEAAKIDGASNWSIMWRIVMPQAFNTIVTVFVLSFITYWNDFEVPLLYMPSYPTCATAIYLFTSRGQGENITNQVPVQLAGCFIMILPILITYIVFNKKLRVSVAMGGIKS